MKINKLWEMYEESVRKEMQLNKKGETEDNGYIIMERCTQNGITNGILRCLEELEGNKTETFQKSFNIYCKVHGKNINTGFGFWIPCSDRLPNKNSNVIACFDDGFITGVEYTNDWELWADSGEVIAWMPLPEPYKK